MRAESEIQDRIRFLLTKELDHQVSEACVRLPCNCKHYHKQPLDSRKEIVNVVGEIVPNENYNRVSASASSIIGLCMLGAETPEEWKGTICEDPIDAQRCLSFELVSTQESVGREFYLQLKNLDWVAINLPEIYGLLWALGTKSMPKLPWWKALWFKFVQIRPDPLVKISSSFSTSTSLYYPFGPLE